MCGIVGYIGNNAVADVLLSGLKNLEYRGYDSSGIALNDNGCINVLRAEGKLDNLRALTASQNLYGHRIHQGIGHIRWATHGAPTVQNAHPHRSNDGKLVLVHNGIIENYKFLREKLKKEGFNFFSDTDTETAVHLIDSFYKKTKSLEDAVVQAVGQLKGAFAFCVMHQDEPDKIIAVKKNAPLIIGLGKDENFIASDIPAIIGNADNIVYLDDNELAVVKKNKVEFKNFEGQKIEKKAQRIVLAEEAISKRGYKHFMIKEISEQADIIRNMLADRMPEAAMPIVFNGVDIPKLIENVSRIEIIGCGTSLHAALVAKYVFETLTGIETIAEVASEYIYKRNLTNSHTLTIGISQSGETADTITAVKQASASGAKVLVVTNRPDSSIVRYADGVINLNAGIEVSVAATKSYTAQLAAMYLLAVSVAEQLHGASSAVLQNIKQDLLEIPVKMEEILNQHEKIKQCAQQYLIYNNFIYIARGINLASAYEGALKLKEISYINAGGYAAGELKHGPIALLDKKMPVVAILTAGSAVYDKMISNCEEAKARNAKIIAVSSADERDHEGLFDVVIHIPQTHELLSPLLVNIPLQLLAYYIADGLGREVDQPRNLAKSVTVE